MRADIALWDTQAVENAGSWDPAAIVLAGPQKTRDLFVEGKQVVSDGQMTTLNLGATIRRQNDLARQLLD
jgi:cytosine/adenosine deaminase-related metal-dependent hydrolase